MAPNQNDPVQKRNSLTQHTEMFSMILASQYERARKTNTAAAITRTMGKPGNDCQSLMNI